MARRDGSERVPRDAGDAMGETEAVEPAAADANTVVPVPPAMTPQELDVRADAVEAVRESQGDQRDYTAVEEQGTQGRRREDDADARS
jgi:hypothetical protein